MNCPACRADLPSEAQFCFACGYRVSAPPPYAVAEAGGGADGPVVLERRKTTQGVSAPRPARETAARPKLPDALAPRIERRADLPSNAVEITATPGLAPSGPDERAQRRYALVAEVTLAGEHNFYVGTAENLSAGGLFVVTADLHPVGTQFDGTFELPEMDRSCRVRCEVRWVREHDLARNLPAGMGLAFLELSRADERAMHVFLQHRDPILFDAK